MNVGFLTAHPLTWRFHDRAVRALDYHTPLCHAGNPPCPKNMQQPQHLTSTPTTTTITYYSRRESYFALLFLVFLHLILHSIPRSGLWVAKHSTRRPFQISSERGFLCQRTTVNRSNLKLLHVYTIGNRCWIVLNCLTHLTTHEFPKCPLFSGF